MNTYIVEVQVHTATVGDDSNAVGVVVPAALKDVHHGDTVIFRNGTAKNPQGVRLWFPLPWHGGTEEVIHLPELNNEVSLTVDTSTWDDGTYTIMYQAFCDEIRELAVGNSPPDMEITKP